MGKFYGQMLPFSQPAFGRQSRCQFFKLMQFSAQPATGAFVLCRRTDNAASTSPGYHLQFPAGRYKLSDRINNELLYLYSAFVPSGTFSKFRHKHKCFNVSCNFNWHLVNDNKPWQHLPFNCSCKLLCKGDMGTTALQVGHDKQPSANCKSKLWFGLDELLSTLVLKFIFILSIRSGYPQTDC